MKACFKTLWAAILLGTIAPPQAAEPGKPMYFQAPGTRQMIERLHEIAAQADPAANEFLNEQRAEIIRQQIAKTRDPNTFLQLQPQYATELLNQGKTEDAIHEFARLEEFAKKYNPEFLQQNKLLLRTQQAVSYMRLGEQENCLMNHSSDSCLLPIQGKGVHQLQRGSRGAIKILTELLDEHPQELGARWLLNICYMTVGEYPDKVPARWLIPPKAFASDYDIKRFPDVAPAVGINVEEISGGSVVEDFDGDGLLDIMISCRDVNGQLLFFHNNGDGTFADRTKAAGLWGLTGGLNLIHADYNNDGWPDVLVLRGAWWGKEGHYPSSLLRNNGDGTFTDVTEAAGLLRFRPTQTAVWFDFNGDGLLDLFIGNESTDGDPIPCELYRNNGDGTFTECAASAGVANIGYVKGVVSADYNNDGKPDLFLSRIGQSKILFRNDGPRDPAKGARSDWKFTDVAKEAGITEPLNSFSTWFFDYDNDGWPDLYVGSFFIRDVGDVAADYLGLPTQGEHPRLYHNNHDGTFTDVTDPMKLHKVIHGMGANFGDLDNDGWLDFYVGTGNPELDTLIPNRMFRNNGGKFFQEVTTSGGFGHLQKGHGVSFADLNNDGQQDVFEQMGGAFIGDRARTVLYANPGHDNHWITLKLEGVKSNRSAIGARIKVTVNGKEGERAIYRTVGSGGSFGASPLRQEIGLGQATEIKSIEVFWPVTGQTQVFKGAAMDRFYAVRENKPGLTELHLKTFKWPAADAMAGHHQEH